ncbi:copia protein [Tanacetum coccineum]
MSLNGAQYQAKDGELCIADSGATHTILKSKKYFFELKPIKGTIDTISGPTNLIDGVGKANAVLPNGTQLLIENALFSLKSKRNLLSFINIYHNGYDTRSRTIENKKYLHIINDNQVFKKLPMLHFGLHYTHINVPQAYMAVKEKYCEPGIFSLWHDRLGHSGSTMMKRIVKNTHEHPLKDQKFPKEDKVPLCTSCSLGKLIARPSPLKVKNESPMFLKRIQVYVPIAPPQRTKMGPQRRLGIYVGYETSSIIRYVEPLTGDVFTARFADCHFNEAIFPPLGGEKKTHEKDVSWSEPSLLYLDPRTKQSETEVQKIMHLQEIANQLPDAFTDTKRVTKSHIPAANAPARVEIPNKQAGNNIAQESQKRLKRGRPIGSKDKNPRKRKGTEKNSDHEENVLNETQDIKTSPEEEINNMNQEMSINYTSNIMGGDDAPEPKSVIDCQNRPDWDKWKDAMQAELNSLNKQKVFGPIVTTPRDVKPVGCIWIFVHKRNEKNEVTRFKARLVAQGFSQRPGIDYEETYSPVMDAITFRYLISLAVSRNLEMRLMDVVIAYLYGSIDSNIYMKILKGFKITESLISKPKELYSIKLQRSLYGLKQSGRMWYNRLSDYLISKGYKSNLICPCVFIKKTTSGFIIIAVYVDDLNIIGTNKEINEVIMHLKEEFEMKDLGKTKYCLGLQIKHMPNGILVHQSNYTETVLKHFNIDKAKSLSTPMVGRLLNVYNDLFRPCEEDEDALGLEVPYLSTIGALMYLTNYAGYLSDPHKAIPQTGYVFLNGGTAISWRSQKQTLVATSSNHAEVIALHEASRECAWLRSMTQLIASSCGLNIKKSPTIIHEDNAACVAQMKEGYIKSDRTKHIPPRYFAYTQDLIKDNQIEMKYV